MPLFDTHSDSEFKNLTRSTLPLLAYWGNTLAALSSIGNALGIHDLANVQPSFEYSTASAGPRDKASYSDVMVVSPSTAIAVEGKWTEPRYETVSKWQIRGNTSNRKRVLSHWLQLIRQKAPGLNEDAISEIPYQMIHRTASACAVGDKQAVVLYQIFLDGHHQVNCAGDLSALVSALGATGIQIWLQEIPLTTTKDYDIIKEKLAMTPVKEIPNMVRSALEKCELFDFGPSHFRRILAEAAGTH
jgi:hypothetical protein